MGVRVAHMLVGRTIDYVQLDEGFALLETVAPRDLHGRTLEGAQVRRRHGVTVVCVKPDGGQWTFATADTVVGERDVLVVAGDTSRVEAFARLGVLLTDTCINYQSVLPPVRGEHLAFGDTGSVIYANSVCGARSSFFASRTAPGGSALKRSASPRASAIFASR